MRVPTAIVMASIMFSCTYGVTFTPVSVNDALDQRLLGRSVFTDTELLKRHLEELPGYVFEESVDGQLEQVSIILHGDKALSVEALAESAPFYHSIIDSNANASASYLVIVSAGIKANEKAEVTIRETAQCWIPNREVPWARIKAWAEDPTNKHGRKRYYVQGVLLADVTKTMFVERESDAKVDGGAAFGFGGKVYASSKSTETSHMSFIGAHLIDIEKVVASPPSAVSEGLDKLAANPRVVHRVKLK